MDYQQLVPCINQKCVIFLILLLTECESESNGNYSSLFEWQLMKPYLPNEQAVVLANMFYFSTSDESGWPKIRGDNGSWPWCSLHNPTRPLYISSSKLYKISAQTF
jgi:hypothetical protein